MRSDVSHEKEKLDEKGWDLKLLNISFTITPFIYEINFHGDDFNVMESRMHDIPNIHSFPTGASYIE